MKFHRPKRFPLSLGFCLFILNSRTVLSQTTPDEFDVNPTLAETNNLPKTTFLPITSTSPTTTEEIEATPPPTTTSTTVETTPPPTTTPTTVETTLPTTTAGTTEATTTVPQSSSSTTSIPEGSYNSECNTTLDCQFNKNLQCLAGTCLCEEPEVFDVREQRCIVPLGKQCQENVLEKDDSNCPEFAECFMDRCVCKTGYSMYTMTRCKSDFPDVEGGESTAETQPKATIWPKQFPSSQEDNDKTNCTSSTCDESKGLECQDGGGCKCKNSEEVYIDEFGRCLTQKMQQSLKDALSLVNSSEDEIKSFVKLLEKFEDTTDSDHEPSASVNRPAHHILDLLNDHKDSYESTPPSTHSQVAPPRLYRYGDLHPAAQETATDSTLPKEVALESDNTAHADRGSPSPSQSTRPIRQDPIPAGHEMGEPLTYGMESRESLRDNDHDGHHNQQYLPLDNYQPQSQEPAIVQREAPAYGGGGYHGPPYDSHHHHEPYGTHPHGEGIPLHGYGVIPEGTNHFRVPFGHGHGHGHGHGYGHHGGFRPGYGGGYGHGFRGPGGYPPLHKPPPKTLLIELAEVLGKSFKLVDRLLPLLYVMNDALKKESLKSKVGGGVRGGRDVSKEKDKEDILKEGALLVGFTKFMGLLLRLKKRVDLLGGADGLKKLLT